MAKKNVTITIQAPKAGAPANLLARAELTFDAGLLAGMRLTGFALWKAHTREGEPFVSVTFPTQPAERGASTLYYDYLRGAGKDAKRVKAAIVKAYREAARTAAPELQDEPKAAGIEEDFASETDGPF